MIEEKIKVLLGEYTFQIFALQHQLEEANKRIKELESKDETKL